MKKTDATTVNSVAEDEFVRLFCEVFGPDKASTLYVQHPFTDIYGRHRYIDFALETADKKIAIEIDGEQYHNPKKVSDEKYIDDLLKQNSLIYQDWDVYRWVYRQLKNNPERVKDELLTFLSKTINRNYFSFLPEQKGTAIELRDYQQNALEELHYLREEGNTIALLYHATGVGKTVTAATDAKRVGGKTLFLVNSLKLTDQAEKRFYEVWPEATRGFYTGNQKDTGVDVLFATIQSVVRNLDDFEPKQFDYIIIDECHHAAAKSYAGIMSYFKPSFTLGLSATPERTDGEDILKLFKRVAHRMDLKEAIENGILVPIRCLRVKTNIDISDVRINGIKYNSLDLESKLFVPERNKLIVETYLSYGQKHNAVIFCASVEHAEAIYGLLLEKGIKAKSVSGRNTETERRQILADYENGTIKVLCACDLLNEGWDSPKTDMLFMARPTLSKTLYLQQLGRGLRKHDGKESLIVFDFVDNANMFNNPYSLHRVLNIAEYRPFGYALAPSGQKKQDDDLFRRSERPEALIDLPVYATDYEQIDLFNWQEEAGKMISQLEFVRMVDVQAETLDKYIKAGKIKSDMAVPISDNRTLHYFTDETVKAYAKQFGWEIIDTKNIKRKFMEFIREMDMSYSYKPVLMLAILDHCDESGKTRICDIVDFFIEFYKDRQARGLKPEKANSIYCRPEIPPEEAKSNILKNPYKRFSDMRFLEYSKDFGQIVINKDIQRRLTAEDYEEIRTLCRQKLDEYFSKLG
ncbi:MAG: type I restriction enzyme EcoKI subunit R [bacterium ADurb.Bin157]|jgi:superfamily II DNA or RNA helicase|nr:DEAD/DEAH box helicase family protein [Candidatus Riflebacteria bacterium]MDD2624803.1 DEAD/DEAH box helicase family protein [Candidatus Riflebacteria bacterium]OQB49786.1 MAG: type I restriction enzyme EcoKI subunit R [bacterium ADurb.Bin157]